MSRRVYFTEDAAGRIVATVRAYERGNRDQPPIHFRNVGDDGGLVLRLGRTVDAIAQGAAGDVTLYENATDAGESCVSLSFEETDEVVCAQNLIVDVTADRWVYLLRPAGGDAWHIVSVADPDADACGRTTADTIHLTVTGCHGSGATAVAHTTGDCPGAITSVTLTNGGKGYALPARVEPTLTITGSGSGCEFTPTLEQVTLACGLKAWAITSVGVSGGSGYTFAETLKVTGGIKVTPATMFLYTAAGEPTLSAAVAGGVGAALSVTLAGGPTYAVDSVTVDDGGGSYVDGSVVTFTAAPGDVVTTPASATIRTARTSPTITAAAPHGTGASLSVSLATDTEDGRDIWKVSSIGVTSGGTGYRLGSAVAFDVTAGTRLRGAVARVSSLGEYGAIEAVTVLNGGKYYRDDGVIESVTVTDGGEYSSETPDYVLIDDGGQYYEEDLEGTPYTDTPSVSLTQESPSAGSGATFTATIDDDPTSETFGKITAIAITNGGSGYFDRKYAYETTWGGLRFHDLPGYNGAVQQILGHEPNGCLHWYDVTTCTPSTSGVCCIDGVINGAITTEADCTDAGGIWKPGAASDDLPGPCC